MRVATALFAAILLLCPSSCSLADITDAHGSVAYTNATISWGPIPGAGYPYKTSLEYDAGGFSMLYQFARSFLDTIQPGGFPFEMIRQMLNGSFAVQDQYGDLVDALLGLAVCIALGLIFTIFMPLCGCCVCCCRCCCGNCGGRLIADKDPNEACKRMGYSQALFLMAICMGVGAACVYVTNDRFTEALEFTNSSIHNNFDDIEIYTNNTIDQFLYMAVDMYDLVNRAISRDISDIGQILGTTLAASLRPFVIPAIDGIIDLDTTLSDTLTALGAVNTRVTSLKQSGDVISDFLSDLASNITSTQSSCSGACVPTNACDTIDPSVLTMGVDFDEFPDLNGTTTNLMSVANRNLTALALQGLDVLNDIPDMLNNETAPFKSDILVILDDYAVMIAEMVDDFIDQVLGAFDVVGLKQSANNYIELAQNYDPYRWYGGVGLMSVFVVIVLCITCGILCGCCGSKKGVLPTQRGSTSNCGGCCLVFAVFIMFVMGGLLMLLTMLVFIVGGSSEKICESLIDLSLFSEFIDIGGIPGFNFAEMLLNNASIPLTFYNVLLGCRANEAPFRLFYFDTLIPLDDYLDYEQYLGGLDSQFDTMANAINLDELVILTPDTLDVLDDFRSSGASTINYTAFDVVLNNDVVAFNITNMITALRSAASLCSTPVSTELDYHATQLEFLRDTLVPALESDMADLGTALDSMQVITDTIEPSIDAAIDGANITEIQLQTLAADTIVNDTKGFLDRILNYVEQYKVEALDIVNTDLAACLPVWNLYQSFVLILCYYSIDALNGFWFGMGWSLVFFVPALVLSMKLSKYYRRMNELGEGYKADQAQIDKEWEEYYASQGHVPDDYDGEYTP